MGLNQKKKRKKRWKKMRARVMVPGCDIGGNRHACLRGGCRVQREGGDDE